jgi:hypothetical protein
MVGLGRGGKSSALSVSRVLNWTILSGARPAVNCRCSATWSAVGGRVNGSTWNRAGRSISFNHPAHRSTLGRHRLRARPSALDAGQGQGLRTRTHRRSTWSPEWTVPRRAMTDPRRAATVGSVIAQVTIHDLCCLENPELEIPRGLAIAGRDNGS